MNPSTSKVVSSNQTPLPNNNNSNNPVAYNPQGYNTFDRSAPHLSSYRFDEVRPFYCMPEIEGNVARVRTAHNLQTETLTSRVLSNVKQDKSFYQIPWSAIAPNSWEYQYRQPIKGDDIDFPSVHQSIDLEKLCIAMRSFTRYLTYYGSGDTYVPTISEFYKRVIPAIIGLNSIFGNATLLKSLHTSMPNEDLLDRYKSLLVESIVYDTDNPVTLSFTDSSGIVHSFTSGSSLSGDSLIDLYQFLDDYEFNIVYLAYQDNPLSVTVTTDIKINSTDLATSNENLANFFGILSDSNNEFYVPTVTDSEEERPRINLMPSIAYQLLCAQFYSNSAIDDFYTGKMWLDNVRSLLYTFDDNSPFALFVNSAGRLVSAGVSETFSYNGLRVSYDAFNGAYMDAMCIAVAAFYNSGSAVTALSQNYYNQFAAFWVTLFGLQRSLKYGDYFVSGRSNPYAVGDTSISVSDNKVLALDVNRNLWAQRFVNAVNRIPQTISEYLKRLTGVEPQNIAPQPHWICTESFNITGMEIENTGDNQGNVVTIFRNEESRYMYEVFIDEPSFIIGVRSFVAENLYPKSSIKISFMNDRLDWFNHFAQHFGDEAILLRELEIPDQRGYGNTPISYQVRYSGFKYGIPYASGAFSFKDSPLKSWAIMPHFYSNDHTGIPVISSSFIRNSNRDFDYLFASLTGTNDATRFHFIIKDFVDDQVNSRQAKFPSVDV